MPLLSGEELPIPKVEELFGQADKDGSGVLEFTEFVWLLSWLRNRQVGGAAAGRLQSVEELRADRLLASQQAALQRRVVRHEYGGEQGAHRAREAASAPSATAATGAA